MMENREIKFRAWDKDDECIRDWNNLVMIRYSSQGDSIFNDNDFVIEQFTGLQDKNGVDIYEGDVVYIAGLGDTVMSWPFTDICEAAAENDIGSILYNIHEDTTEPK